MYTYKYNAAACTCGEDSCTEANPFRENDPNHHWESKVEYYINIVGGDKWRCSDANCEEKNTTLECRGPNCEFVAGKEGTYDTVRTRYLSAALYSIFEKVQSLSQKAHGEWVLARIRMRQHHASHNSRSSHYDMEVEIPQRVGYDIGRVDPKYPIWEWVWMPNKNAISAVSYHGIQ